MTIDDCQYKLGQQVRIKDMQDIYEGCIFNFCQDMASFCGKIMTIKSISVRRWKDEEVFEFHFREPDGGWHWSEDMIEPFYELTEEDVDDWMKLLTNA